jgi:hypothetical protein
MNPPGALPGQIPMFPPRARTAAVLAMLLSRTRRLPCDLDAEVDCPELVRLRARRRRAFRRGRR